MSQLTFDDLLPDEDGSIQAAFESFHLKHPDVYRLFVMFAESLWDAGRKRYSSKSIIERIRWEYDTGSSAADEEFKINNNFTSRYVRKLISDQPKFASFFELRALQKA